MERVTAPQTQRGFSIAIKTQDLRHTYRRREDGTEITAVESLSMCVKHGEILSIVGSSGCGKSTFLRLLLGLEQPTQGCIQVEGLTPHERSPLLRGLFGAVFQEDRLLPWRTTLENVRLGLEIKGSRIDRDREAAKWLELVGLGGLGGAYPHELSGGMRQRVAMARAFAPNPKIILADEAFSHLDVGTAAGLRRQFLQVAQNAGITVVFVTHDVKEALEIGDRTVIFAKPARVVAEFDGSQISGSIDVAQVEIERLLGVPSSTRGSV